MKNKYDIMAVRPTYGVDTNGEKEYTGEEEYAKHIIVADAVVNNDGYLTFMDLPTQTVAGAQTPAKLVQIVAKGEWYRVINQGPFIAAVQEETNG
jgi:hypothetical protein